MGVLRASEDLSGLVCSGAGLSLCLTLLRGQAKAEMLLLHTHGASQLNMTNPWLKVLRRYQLMAQAPYIVSRALVSQAASRVEHFDSCSSITSLGDFVGYVSLIQDPEAEDHIPTTNPFAN